MKQFWMLLLLPFLFVYCGNKKVKLTGEDAVVISDFIDFFQPVKLPYQLDDSVLTRKESDSILIGSKVFSQFVPDSVLVKQFGKGVKPKLYPLGRVSISKFETYLFLKAVTSSKKIGYILAFDKKNNFITGMPLVIADKDAETYQVGSMDTKYTVTQSIQKKKTGAEMEEKKNVYILNAEAQTFSLIMTDEGMPQQTQEVINPIDTFARRNKFSGDYIKDKRNFISVRDGRNAANILFFIHFEKDNGECKGELKGEAALQGPKTAVYHANGNPCELELTFNGSTVSMKELQACGSFRDIKCFFDGSFTKRKESKPKPGNKRK